MSQANLRRLNTTIITRHSADCSHRDDPQYKRCSCWKHLRYAAKKNGKSVMVWLATKERTWAKAEDFQRDFEQANDPMRREDAPVTKVTTRDAIDSFLADKTGQCVAKNTIGIYRLHLDRLRAFLETSNVFFLQDVKLQHLTAYRATWEPIYPGSSCRHQVQGHVKTFFKYASINYDLPRNPADGLSKIKVTAAVTQPFNPAEYQAILDAVPQAFTEASLFRPRMMALIQLMRHSGLAISDATRLRRDSIHLAKDGSARIITKRIKTKVDLCIPIPKEVVEAMAAVPVTYGTVSAASDHVFWDGESTIGVVRNYWKAFSRVFEKAKIVGGHPHRLRDTFAVECLKSGKVSLWQVSKLLGHTNINTTQKHYAPWVQELQDQTDRALRATWLDSGGKLEQ